MAFQSVPDTAEAVTAYIWNGVVITNTFYARYPGVYDAQAVEDLCVAVDDWVAEDVLSQLATGVSYLGTFGRGLEFENDVLASSVAGAGSGTNVGSSMTPQASFCISRLSTLTGRSARGRIYVPMLVVSALESNRNFVTEAYANLWVASLETLNTAVVGAGWIPVIVSRYSGGAQRPFGLTFPIDRWGYSTRRVATQRGRLIEVS